MNLPSSEGTTAHEYLRVSVDGSGREESQDSQHDDNQRARDAHGWALGRSYRDTGSASRYARKARGDFDRLLKDLRSGHAFRPGNVLQLWESSRGSREQVEWATFLNLLRDAGVLLWVTSHDRLYDLTNPRDRRTLDEDGVDSAYESGKTSLRIRRHTAANAAKGRPHGRPPYGYRRTYNPETGRLETQVPKAGEAEVIRELFDRLTQRQSLRSIARDFAARGIQNASGKPFSGPHLRTLATNPTYAGIRIHAPDMTGQRNLAIKNNPGVSVIDGQWEALVSLRTFYAVQEFLTNPSRKTTSVRPGRAVHFLSVIAKCGACGDPLMARNTKSEPIYVCHKRGCVRIKESELDDFAEDVILTTLASEKLYEVLAPHEQNEAELARVRDDLAELRARYVELSDAVSKGQISPRLAGAAETKILQDIADAEKVEQALLTPSALEGLIKPGADVRDRWLDAELSTKREIARLLLSADVLGELRVVRSWFRDPVEERVEFWKPDTK